MRTLFWTCTLAFCLSSFVSAQSFEQLQATIVTNVSPITSQALNNLGRTPPTPELVSASKAIVETATKIYALPNLPEEERRWTLQREAVALIVLAYAEPATYYFKLALISDELEKMGGLQNQAQRAERNVLEIGSELATRTGNNAVNINWESLAQRMVMYAEKHRGPDSLRMMENFVQRIRNMNNALYRDHRFAVVTPIFIKYYQDINHEDSVRALEPDLFRSTLQGTPMPLRGVDIDGNDFVPASVRDKVVLLYFWGTWCVQCKPLIPDLIALHEKYHADGLVILGINTGISGDDERTVKHYLDTQTFGGKKIPWMNLHEGLAERKYRTSITKMYGISELPVMILIGRDGKVRRLHPSINALDGYIAEATSIFAGIELTEEEKRQRDEALRREQEEIERQLRGLPGL